MTMVIRIKGLRNFNAGSMMSSGIWGGEFGEIKNGHNLHSQMPEMGALYNNIIFIF